MSDEFIGGLSIHIASTSGASSPPAFRKLENLTDISGFGSQHADVDTTNFDSVAKEFIAGLLEGNEFSVTAALTNKGSPNVQDYVYALRGSKVAIRLKAVDKSTSPNRTRTFSFVALIRADDWDFQKEDKNSLSFSFKPSGAITMVKS